MSPPVLEEGATLTGISRRQRLRTCVAHGPAALAVLAVLLAAAAASACGAASTAAPGESATAVSTPELGEVGSAPAGTPEGALTLNGVDPTTGKTVSLAEFAGKPIVLNFWASWCPPCREELPALMELARAHPEIQIVGINLQDAASDARELQQEIGFDWPSITDADGEIQRQLGVIGMPTTFFLDAEHRITGQVVGGTDVAGFEQGLGLSTTDGT